jgi:hypothetical protein
VRIGIFPQPQKVGGKRLWRGKRSNAILPR